MGKASIHQGPTGEDDESQPDCDPSIPLGPTLGSSWSMHRRRTSYVEHGRTIITKMGMASEQRCYSIYRFLGLRPRNAKFKLPDILMHGPEPRLFQPVSNTRTIRRTRPTSTQAPYWTYYIVAFRQGRIRIALERRHADSAQGFARVNSLVHLCPVWGLPNT